MQETSSEQVTFLLQFMKDVPEFKDYFVKDFFRRGEQTLQRAAHSDFENIDSFRLNKYRAFMEEKAALDPFNLMFFGDKIFELSFVPEDKLAEVIIAYMDLCLGFTLVFKQSADYHMNLDLFKALRKGLSLLNSNLSLFANNEGAIEKLFKNKLLQCLTINLNLDESELKARKQIIVELIVELNKLCLRYNSEFNKKVELGFELSDSLRKALTVFRKIEEGNKFTSFLAKRKFTELLNSKVDS